MAYPTTVDILIEDDTQDRILDTAEKLGATVLGRNHHWGERNGICGAFRDPWGTEIVRWSEGGEHPPIPDHFTRG